MAGAEVHPDRNSVLDGACGVKSQGKRHKIWQSRRMSESKVGRLEATLDGIRGIVARAKALEALQRETVELVRREMKGYDWVGYYMLDPADEDFLVLGPYSGAATEHTRIPVSEGICGAAVATGETLVIDDVRADPRYLACSIETQSEIVVPLRVWAR
jgi:GAF domain-containing protein